jgi:hypothetical protein
VHRCFDRTMQRRLVSHSVVLIFHQNTAKQNEAVVQEFS